MPLSVPSSASFSVPSSASFSVPSSASFSVPSLSPPSPSPPPSSSPSPCPPSPFPQQPLPTRLAFTTNYIRRDRGPEATLRPCPICLQPWSDVRPCLRMVHRECRHAFCGACIEAWSCGGNRCPVCGVEVFADEDKAHDAREGCTGGETRARRKGVRGRVGGWALDVWRRCKGRWA